MDTDTAKIDKEKRFHNERFSHDIDPRSHLNRWYHSIRHGAIKQDSLVIANSNEKDVLEYGCADGGLSLGALQLPRYCKNLFGIDISDVAIQKATQKAASDGYANAKFFPMNAEAMTFPDQSFDLVFGRGILHHLDLEKSFSEISRVLRKGGVAVFTEPMGHNFFLNLYRNKTPDIRTQDEHPLLVSDFAIARRHFSSVDVEFFGFFSILSGLFSTYPNGFLYNLTKSLDSALLRLPFVGRYAWHCLIVCRKL